MTDYTAALLLTALRAELEAVNDALTHVEAEVTHYKTKRSEIVQTIKALEGTKGYNPTPAPDAEPSIDPFNNVEDAEEVPSAPVYGSMSVRGAINAFFVHTDNDRATIDQIAAGTGKRRASIYQVISCGSCSTYKKVGTVNTGKTGRRPHLFQMRTPAYRAAQEA